MVYQVSPENQNHQDLETLRANIYFKDLAQMTAVLEPEIGRKGKKFVSILNPKVMQTIPFPQWIPDFSLKIAS